jgi:hypothetical protein
VADFGRPPAAGDGDEERHGRRGALRGPAQVEGQIVRAGDQAADEQDVPRARGGGQRPVREPGALGPVPARAPLEDRVPDRLVRADDGPGRQGEAEVARDDRHVGQAAGLAEPAQLAAAAIDLVIRGPLRGQARREQAPDLGDGQLRLGLALELARDSRGPAPPPVLLPPLRHEHVEVRPGLPGRGHPRGEHRGDAVLHVPGAPGVLRRHARGRVPVLELRGLINRDPRPGQVTRVAGQPGEREPGQLRPQVRPVPPVGAEQGLHPVRALVPGRLRQAPAVRLHPRRQLPHVIQRGPRAAPLRHNPAQHRPDLRIRPRRAPGHVFYAGLYGRVVVVCGHASGNPARPPRISLA